MGLEMSADSLLNERRGSPRVKAQHDAQLLFIAEVEPSAQGSPNAKFIAHTYDISMTGLSLIANKVHVSDFESCQPGSRMKLMLSIPLGVIEIDVEVVRGKWVNEDDRSGRYFIAVRIEGIAGDAQPQFFEYLKTIG